jgi:hypothetical protein
MAPVLFLDIDGVLHPGSGSASGKMCRAPDLADALVGQELRIVISSSWRFHMALQKIVDMLPNSISERVIGATGDAHIGRWPRYNEIRKWVATNDPFADWRALDDARLEFPNPCPPLIACDPRTGLGDAQLRALVGWLSDGA